MFRKDNFLQERIRILIVCKQPFGSVHILRERSKKKSSSSFYFKTTFQKEEKLTLPCISVFPSAIVSSVM